MIVRLGGYVSLGQCTDPESGESVDCPTAGSNAAAASLPPFCDPTWTAMNGGVCTDAVGNYRTSSGATVTSDQIIQAMKTPVTAAKKTAGLPFNIDTTTLAFIVGGLFFFALVLPRGRR